MLSVASLAFTLGLHTLLVSGAATKRALCPDGVNAAIDPVCCAFHTLRDDLMTNLFNMGCGEEVHETLRLAFHDSMGFSPSLTLEGEFGGTGADGSPLLFPAEAEYAANQGISGTIDALTPFWRKHNVSAADLVQFAGAAGLTLCPGAPKLQFLAGRQDATDVPPDGLTPSPADSTDFILERFRDAGGFTPNEVVSLLASHSIARADLVDPSIKEAPFDTTPFTFDTQFFLVTLLRGVGFPGSSGNSGEGLSPLPELGVLRLFSDHELARDSRTACQWQSFIDDQQGMARQFKAAMAKLAVIGQDVSSLVDCTEALPDLVGGFVKNTATFPATKSFADVEQVCSTRIFPVLTVDPVSVDIPHCPNGESDC